MTDAFTRTVQLSTEFIENGDPLGWFEALYAAAKGDPAAVPWARLTPNAMVLEWLDRGLITGKKVVVIGCGLGDDAEELANRGFDVTAFDISQSAIAWCQNRFPDSSVTYVIADLFALPDTWNGAFDFVLECYTIQAMPPELRSNAIPKIAGLVAKSGQLLVVCRGRGSDQPLTTVPFPLTKAELAGFEQAGLNAVVFEDLSEPIRRFRVQYRK